MGLASHYYAVKHLHIACVSASGALFLLRGMWMLAAPGMLQRRWVRTLPHLVDTLLLASAVTLAVLSGQYPFAQDWLGAKVIALVVYVLLGGVALRRGRTRAIRATAFGAALVTFAYIVSVAVTKHVVPFA
ncbi:SirB2 family protein [[Empedobacter] haloabium]|uniref:SirB2 family protein n=1 Tax=[Empedobacter] haloabium TaxID=592317 RepID=A0ABZ1UFD0_9BURK